MTAIAAAIKKVATGPHLSKALSLGEARDSMLEILSGTADPVQAAIFFIALRMKIETEDENLGLLTAIQQQTPQVNVDLNNLLNIVDPFNGFNRHLPVATFLPAVLASCGLPALSQGVFEMGPKFGVTHAQVLSEAGINIKLSTIEASKRITNPSIGWAYLDQAQSSPDLYALKELRTKMIKRPSLSTLEKLLMPIKATGKTHLQIGFVHKAYPAMLAFLANQSSYDSALIVRGLEGGVLPTLRENSNCFRAQEDELNECSFDPTEFTIDQTTRGVLPQRETVTAEETLSAGLSALSGQSGPAMDSLIFGSAMALWHCGIQSSQRQAADSVRQSIKTGRALDQFKQGID